MHFLEHSGLSRLTAVLEDLDVGDRILSGRLELFSTKKEEEEENDLTVSAKGKRKASWSSEQNQQAASKSQRANGDAVSLNSTSIIVPNKSPTISGNYSNETSSGQQSSNFVQKKEGRTDSDVSLADDETTATTRTSSGARESSSTSSLTNDELLSSPTVLEEHKNDKVVVAASVKLKADEEATTTTIHDDNNIMALPSSKSLANHSSTREDSSTLDSSLFVPQRKRSRSRSSSRSRRSSQTLSCKKQKELTGATAEGSRELLVQLVSTMNACFPDYDFRY